MPWYRQIVPPRQITAFVRRSSEFFDTMRPRNSMDSDALKMSGTFGEGQPGASAKQLPQHSGSLIFRDEFSSRHQVDQFIQDLPEIFNGA